MCVTVVIISNLTSISRFTLRTRGRKGHLQTTRMLVKGSYCEEHIPISDKRYLSI